MDAKQRIKYLEEVFQEKHLAHHEAVLRIGQLEQCLIDQKPKPLRWSWSAIMRKRGDRPRKAPCEEN
jgi:hypothetical protein